MLSAQEVLRCFGTLYPEIMRSEIPLRRFPEKRFGIADLSNILLPRYPRSAFHRMETRDPAVPPLQLSQHRTT